MVSQEEVIKLLKKRYLNQPVSSKEMKETHFPEEKVKTVNRVLTRISRQHFLKVEVGERDVFSRKERNGKKMRYRTTEKVYVLKGWDL